MLRAATFEAGAETRYTPDGPVTVTVEGQEQRFDINGASFTTSELEFLTAYDWGPTTWVIPELGDLGEEPFALLRGDLVDRFGETQGTDLFNRVTAIDGVFQGSCRPEVCHAARFSDRSMGPPPPASWGSASSAPWPSRSASARSGFNQTEPIGVQSRAAPDHRFGFWALAA